MSNYLGIKTAKRNSWPFRNGQIYHLAISKWPSHFKTLQKYQNDNGHFEMAKGFETASNICFSVWCFKMSIKLYTSSNILVLPSRLKI